MRRSAAGTQGWYSCEPLSARRFGIPGPNKANPLEESPFYLAVKLRQAGDHEQYRSILEWDAEANSWMLLVLDKKRNIVGQTIGRTPGRLRTQNERHLRHEGPWRLQQQVCGRLLGLTER